MKPAAAWWAREWGALLLAAAVALQGLAARAPGAVERVYARGVYPLVRSVFAVLTGRVPFSVAELVLAVMALAASAAVVRAGWRMAHRHPGVARAGALTRLGRAARAALATAGVVYTAFLFAWGLNHQRPPLAALIGLRDAGGRADELSALSRELMARADDLRRGLGEDPAGVLRLSRGRRAALDAADAGLRRAAAAIPLLDGPSVRPKPALLSPLLSRLGISGIFVPFTGEAHVNTTLPDVDVPFAACHELAHQRGFAREDEANYLAYAACVRHPDPEFRYSGTLAASLYVQAALAGVDREAARRLAGARSAPVRRDIQALVEWQRRYRSRLTQVSERVNDAYLRSQGHELGIRSYGAMVDLLLAERRATAAIGNRQ